LLKKKKKKKKKKFAEGKDKQAVQEWVEEFEELEAR